MTALIDSAMPSLWERLAAKSLTITRFDLGHVDFGSDKWRRSLEESWAASPRGG
jgi:hypothetical protein